MNTTHDKGHRELTQIKFTMQVALLWLLAALGTHLASALIEQFITERNRAWQRNEINQAFDGQAFLKDNAWVYSKEIDDLAGMPAQYVNEVLAANQARHRQVA